MLIVKRLLVYLLVGALAGLVVASLIGPSLLGWYNAPAAGGALCKCEEVTRATAEGIIRTQMIGSAIGAALFLILGAFIERARSQKRRNLPPTVVATPGPSLPTAPTATPPSEPKPPVS